MSIAAVLFMLTACDNQPPTQPTPPSTPAVVVGLEIEGPPTVAPGQSAQYSLVERLSDGSARPVSRANWSTNNRDLLQVSQSGLVTTAPLHGDAILQAHLEPTAAGPRLATREIQTGD